MALRTKFPIVVLLSCFIFVLGAVALEFADPEAELQRCKHQCRALRRADEWQKRVCKEKCDKYCEEKQRRECQEEGWKKVPERPRKANTDPYRKCKEQCHEELDVPKHQRPCERRCEEVYRERKQRGEKERQQNRSRQPYVSQDQDFAISVEIQHGRARVMQKFV